LEVWLTNWKVQSPEILGTEGDLVLGQVATANNLSNTPGGVRLKEQLWVKGKWRDKRLEEQGTFWLIPN